jgi:hypothetical protein
MGVYSLRGHLFKREVAYKVDYILLKEVDYQVLN